LGPLNLLFDSGSEFYAKNLYTCLKHGLCPNLGWQMEYKNANERSEKLDTTKQYEMSKKKEFTQKSREKVNQGKVKIMNNPRVE
jgi:hypothetical protein